MSYNNDMQAILKKVVSEHPNAPALRLELVIDGKKYKAGLWPWTRKDGSPVQDKAGNGQYIGKVEVDTYGEQIQENGIQQAKHAVTQEGIAGGGDPFHDDSIPF